MSTRTRVSGFTIIEMLVVLAIVGILMILVIPSYTQYTLKSNRSDAFAALNEIMQAQERYAADNGTYTVDLTQLGYLAIQPSERGLYNVSAATCGGIPITQCVLLSAAAQDRQINDKNSDDGTLNIPITLNSRGARTGWNN